MQSIAANVGHYRKLNDNSLLLFRLFAILPCVSVTIGMIFADVYGQFSFDTRTPSSTAGAWTAEDRWRAIAKA